MLTQLPHLERKIVTRTLNIRIFFVQELNIEDQTLNKNLIFKLTDFVTDP